MTMSRLRIAAPSCLIMSATLGATLASIAWQPARAVPAFAAQTGQPCQMCHIGALGPQLTPYGRNFKIKGYTQTGGTGLASEVHLAVWLQPEFTSIQKDIPPAGVTPDFAANNNAYLNAVSLFYAGRITNNVGAFLQLTYDNVGKALAQDNSEIRVVGSGTPFGTNVDYGVQL